MAEQIYPEFHRFLSRDEKEKLLKQRGIVLWLYGLSGSGKSTIANLVERDLHRQGQATVILDGDNLRSGLNSDLGFSDEERSENVRRVAEVAKIFANQGIITMVSVITPLKKFRGIARQILGRDFNEVYVKANYDTCAQRDPKGLYAKVEKGSVKHFTGRDSEFEEPEEADLILDTQNQSAEQCAQYLIDYLARRH